MAKEYEIYGRIIGVVDAPVEKLGKVQAESKSDAIKIAKRSDKAFYYKITNAIYLGELNEKWIPEEALRSAIFDEDYKEQRYKDTKNRPESNYL